MLRQLRNSTKSFGMKAFLMVLLVGVGSWGIGDVVSTAVTSRAAIEVGDIEVSPQELANAFQRQSDQIMRLVDDRAMQDILRQQTANQLVTQFTIQAALDQAALDLGVTVSDTLVRTTIQSDPGFMDADGTFDRNLMQQALFSSGFTEQSYVRAVRSDLRRATLVEALNAAVTAPAPIVRQLYRFRNQTRTAETLLIAPEDVAAPGPAAESDLREIYDNADGRFMAPERRDLSVLLLTPGMLADDIKIEEAEARRLYEERSALYTEPPRRVVEQALLPTEDAARAALDELRGVSNFAEVAARLSNLPIEAIRLGDLTFDEAPEELAEDIFRADSPGMVGPVESPFGWHVLNIAEILPETRQSFEEVRPQIEDELRNQAAFERVYERSLTAEDAILAGDSLEQAALSAGAEILTVSGTDRDGLTRDGAPAFGEGTPAAPHAARILQTGFTTPETEVSQIVETGEAYFFVRVDRVQPSTKRPFDEVRGELEDEYRERAIRAAMLEKAATLQTEIEGGATMADLADREGLTVETVGPFRRDQFERLPPDLVRALFRADEDEVTTSATPAGVFVAQLIDIETPEPDAASEALTATRQAIERQLNEDLLSGYVAALRDLYGVMVNQALIDQIVNPTRAQDL